MLLAACSLLPACASVRFYGQAVCGQLELSLKRRSIERLVASDDTPAALRERLRSVQRIVAFAREGLALPDTGSYRSFADLDREATVWLVAAAPPDSLEARRWCFPIAGCVPYRGYFREAGAEREAARLRERGLETAVTPSVAYSTLGWLDDPVVRPMLRYDDLTLAGILFHELAHERVYVPGDARFNESYASAVEQLGRERFAREHGLAFDPAAVERARRRERSFVGLLLAARRELAALYAQGLPAPALVDAKARVLADLEDRFRRWREQQDGYTGFDHWFEDGPPNNARLALLATYELAVPAFEALFVAQGRDFARFHAAVERLAELPATEREAKLAALAPP